MATQQQAERIEREVMEPMRQRWTARDLFAMSDYLDDLAEFDADTLRAAMLVVRRAKPNRRYWPDSVEIRDACLAHRQGAREFGGAAGGSMGDEIVAATQRCVKADELVAKAMNRLWLWPKPWFPVAKRYLRDQALTALREGVEEPWLEIPAEQMAAWDAHWAELKRHNPRHGASGFVGLRESLSRHMPVVSMPQRDEDDALSEQEATP